MRANRASGEGPLGGGERIGRDRDQVERHAGACEHEEWAPRAGRACDRGHAFVEDEHHDDREVARSDAPAAVPHPERGDEAEVREDDRVEEKAAWTWLDLEQRERREEEQGRRVEEEAAVLAEEEAPGDDEGGEVQGVGVVVLKRPSSGDGTEGRTVSR